MGLLSALATEAAAAVLTVLIGGRSSNGRGAISRLLVMRLMGGAVDCPAEVVLSCGGVVASAEVS